MISDVDLTRSEKKYDLISTINVTPFVDIMLVLLVIFMVSAPEIMPSLLIELPKVEKAEVTNNSEPLILTISRNGAIYLNDKLIKQELLIENLMKLANDNKEARVFIRGDEKSDYGVIIQVISQVSNSGFKKVALVTKN